MPHPRLTVNNSAWHVEKRKRRRLRDRRNGYSNVHKIVHPATPAAGVSRSAIAFSPPHELRRVLHDDRFALIVFRCRKSTAVFRSVEFPKRHRDCSSTRIITATMLIIITIRLLKIYQKTIYLYKNKNSCQEHYRRVKMYDQFRFKISSSSVKKTNAFYCFTCI